MVNHLESEKKIEKAAKNGTTILQPNKAVDMYTLRCKQINKAWLESYNIPQYTNPAIISNIQCPYCYIDSYVALPLALASGVTL